MNVENNNKNQFRQCVSLVQGLSFFCMVATMSVRIFSASFSPMSAFFDSASCVAIILLCPIRSENPSVSVVLAFAVLLGAVFLAFAGVRMDEEVEELYYCLLITLSLGAMEIWNVLDFIRDNSFLGSAVAGWDVALIYIRQFFTIFFLLIVFQQFSIKGAGAPKIVLSASTVLMVCLYIVLLVRSFTNKNVFVRGTRIEPLPGSGEGMMPRLKLMGPIRQNLQYKSLFDRITAYMDERKPFLESDFTLEDMARAMFTNKSYLSRVINICTNMNFSQFVNKYRIMYAVSLYKKDPKLKMTELSAMSGFSNKVTFNMNFKLFMDGKTPKVWCDEYLDSVRAQKRPSSSTGREPRRALPSSSQGG